MSKRYATRPFGPDLIDDAAVLRAADHARHRLHRPMLDAAYEEPANVRPLIEEIIGRDAASGTFVSLDGQPAAYILGAPRADPRWQSNMYVEDAGFGGSDREAVREAYAAAAGAWVAAGHANHYVIVSATDEDQVEAWFSLSFGKQHVHALRPRAAANYMPEPPSGLLVRPKERRDLSALAELGRVVPSHVQGSPVFSFIPVPTLEESTAEAEEEMGDARFAEFVAEHLGRVIATAVGCSLELSGMTTKLMRPANAGFLGHAAVLPHGRGLGAGRALGQTIIAWSRDAGYDTVATDWRSTNLEANRTWPALGFEPSFYRLHRLVG